MQLTIDNSLLNYELLNTMSIKINVPSIACEVCAKTITQAIQSQQPNAIVEVDVSQKIVTVQTEASKDSIKQIIIAAGHTPE